MLRHELPKKTGLWLTGGLVSAILIVGMFSGEKITRWGEIAAFPDAVIYAESTPYQRIVLTASKHELRLYLNSNLQFSTKDEYRYHEALVHPGLSRLPNAKNVLILGGGDGLAAREVLRYPRIESVTLVDLDPAMTRLFATNELLTSHNQNALTSPRVKVENADAFIWLGEQRGPFDFVIIDFPDPSNFSLGKLYSTTFYQRLRRSMSPEAALVVQSTSPFVARKSFWCVDATLQASGLHTEPYHTFVPSFGEWGFILASHKPLSAPASLPEGLRFINEETLAQLPRFPPDMARLTTETNHLSNQALVRYFEEEWAQ
jgi:spermidine synthase